MRANMQQTNENQQKDIHLYTASTMNGWKPVIFLEEAGVDYALTPIDFSKKEQKAPDYVKLNPNGRIPPLSIVPTMTLSCSNLVPSFGTWRKNIMSFCRLRRISALEQCNG